MDLVKPGALRRVTNGAGRSNTHIYAGLAIFGGIVLASWLVAARNAPTHSHPRLANAQDKLEQPDFAPPKEAFAFIWPPLYALLALAGARLWNAPESPERKEALKAWTAIQGLITSWMALRQKRTATVATAAASVGTTANFLKAAYQVDRPAALMTVPFLGWILFATALTMEVWRRNRDKPESVGELQRLPDARPQEERVTLH